MRSAILLQTHTGRAAQMRRTHPKHAPDKHPPTITYARFLALEGQGSFLHCQLPRK
jgi:hypothetical protein